MNALPAQVAGVREIVMVVPTPNGAQSPLVLAAAHIAGVTRAFTIGGAQAIAALAYGTATILAFDKIVGPGNAYVAAAKRRVFGAVGIDMVAGPSEIIVIADRSANPDWIAMDLFSQAEHDEAGRAILLPPEPELTDAVARSIAPASSDVTQGDHCGIARQPRRPVRVARSQPRPAPSRTTLPGASRAGGRQTGGFGRRGYIMQARSSSAISAPRQ